MTNNDVHIPAQRRRGWIAGAIVAAAVAAYAAAWFITASVIAREVARFLDVQRGAGVTIATEPMQTRGFPGRVQVTIPHLSAAGKGWSWDADRIAVSAWPLTWHVLDIDLGRRHRLAGLVSPPEVPVWIGADQAGGEIVLDLYGRMTRGAVRLDNAVVSLSAGGDAWLRAGSARAEAMLLPVADTAPGGAHPATAPPTARLELEADDVTPPNLLPMPVAGPIRRAALTAEVTGRWPAGPLPDVLEAWRSAGGTVEIKAAALDWPPLHIAGSGTVALNAALQPEGALALQVQGGGAVLDMLAAGGVVSRDAAGAAQMALALMSRRNADGVSELAVPLTLQDRRLSAGPLALGKVGELAWPKVVVP